MIDWLKSLNWFGRLWFLGAVLIVPIVAITPYMIVHLGIRWYSWVAGGWPLLLLVGGILVATGKVSWE